MLTRCIRGTASLPIVLLASLFLVTASGCGEDDPPPTPAQTEAPTSTAIVEPELEPEPLVDPVPAYRDGKKVGDVEAAEVAAKGLIVLDLGDDWVPYIFTERSSPEQEPIENPYRSTYLALARGEYPDDHHGRRAKTDQFLELYGIPPTVSLMRERYEATQKLACVDELDFETLRAFDGFISYESNDAAKRSARRYEEAEREVKRLLRKAAVDDIAGLDLEALTRAEQRAVRDYQSLGPSYRVISAAQDRLLCEGYLERGSRFVRGGLDWLTHEALAMLERRHRVFGWGFIGRDTLPILQQVPIEGDHESVIRVLTERAMHAANVLEDGSRSTSSDGKPATFLGADGKRHPVPNFEAELRERLISAFGLETPESTLAFLRSLGELEGNVRVAIPGIERPEYYSGDMQLSVELDRGDVWYDFPFDAEGNERPQPVSRRPRLTIYTEYRGQKIALARYGTTVGGWRSEYVDGTLMWAYKGSPTGDRVWRRIVAAPVWVPPATTPPRGLLTRNGGTGRDRWAPNVHEMGPSYASAYGLVAAYHQRETVGPDGSRSYGGDQGIRTHGSVDYMSIMRRHSHGCHRLHNHLAVRMMSFILRHKKHRRMGPDQLTYGRNFKYDGYDYSFALTKGGYTYLLEDPIDITVLPGRVLGRQMTPIAHVLPQYNREVGAYVMPDGTAVAIAGDGSMTPIPHPWAGDAGVMAGIGGDGGVPSVSAEPSAAPVAPAPVAPAPVAPVSAAPAVTVAP